MARHQLSTLIAAGFAAVVAACSAPAVPPSGAAPSSTPVTVGAVDFGHIHAVDLDPADGSVLAATHHGVFRVGPRRGTARLVGPAHDFTAFTVTRTITEDGPLLGSGHEDDPRTGTGTTETGTTALGLIVSDDGARTWASVALHGQADFHALSAAGATVYGLDTVSGTVMRSDDYGQHWQHGARLTATGLDVDPYDPLHVLLATPGGLRESLDGGITISPVKPQPPQPLLLVDHVFYRFGTDRFPAVTGVDADGRVWALVEAGWQLSGMLPAAPSAFTVIAPDGYLAATGQSVLRSEDAGRSWTSLT